MIEILSHGKCVSFMGCWPLQVANQDHSCILGVETIDSMIHGSKEFTLLYPSLANARGAKNHDLLYNTARINEIQTW